jgi:F0F1-type ATP synthase membrane subunit b/b'
MDLAGRLAQLEQIVRDAKSMPLSSSVLISRDEVLEMLHEMQESLPEEIKQARWVVKDREELLAKARAEGDRIIEQAHEDQRRMSMKDAVAKRAQEESARMLQEAEDTTVGMRREAEDYVDSKLAQFEIALRKILEDAQGTARSLAKTLDQVEVGRDRLRSPTTVAEQELAPPDLQGEPSELFDGEAGGEGFAGGEGLR